MTDNTTLYIILGILILHFLVGVGYLFYKILKGEKPKSTDKE